MKPECSWMWASSQKKPSTGWKMFPMRAGRSHFSRSNFQMQDTEEGMSASVCLSIFPCVYHYFTTDVVDVSISNEESKKVSFSPGGRYEWFLGDFTTFVCEKSSHFNTALLYFKERHLYLISQAEKEYLVLFLSHTAGERWICSCSVSDSDFITYPHRNCQSIKPCSFTD